MTTHELLELAALDAMGLLEDDEREAFDKAFRAAAPALQAQVRLEQTRIAKDERMLPEVSPPIGLRARVLAAWREAVQTFTARQGSPRRHGAGRFLPPLLPSRGVTPIWRAVAIGCAAASIVLGFATYEMKSAFEKAASASNENFVDEVMRREFGPAYKRAMFSPKTRIVQFTPVADDAQTSKGEAFLLLDKEHKIAEFFCRQLPADGAYQLVLVNANGDVVKDVKWSCVIKTTEGSSTEFHQKIQDLNLDNGESLAIQGADSSSDSRTFLLKSM